LAWFPSHIAPDYYYPPSCGEALWEDLACHSQEAYLTLLFALIDANIGYGWSPLCGMGRVLRVELRKPHVRDQPRHHISTRGRFRYDDH
jgi:hypothetical protein